MFRSYPLTWLVVVAIHILCLFPLPETPLDGIAFIDKWTHIVMYAGLCLTIWYEWLCRHGRFTPHVLDWLRHRPTTVTNAPVSWRRLRIGALYLPIILGGYIEVLQATCTGGTRSGDVMDWLADAVGVILIWPMGWMLARKL